MSSWTACTILRQKDGILSVDPSKSVTRTTKNWTDIVDDAEKLFIVWINDKQLLGDMTNEPIICEMSWQLYDHLFGKTNTRPSGAAGTRNPRIERVRSETGPFWKRIPKRTYNTAKQ